MVDCLGAIYAKNNIEISCSIESGANYNEN